VCFYGDIIGDGMVQLLFILFVVYDKCVEGVVLQFVVKMGLEFVMVVYVKVMGLYFIFFVVYGLVYYFVDLLVVEVVECEYLMLLVKEVNGVIKSWLCCLFVVVGVCIGIDVYIVGIDVILNIKGFVGEKGLEYYFEICVVNFGV